MFDPRFSKVKIIQHRSFSKAITNVLEAKQRKVLAKVLEEVGLELMVIAARITSIG